ncbi:hypothetical protein JTB14_010769 [Gonioctena quinquepunctata]|nr:hypothetical protein JTB14_010769 [Gonioctena quinquepunctata]
MGDLPPLEEKIAQKTPMRTARELRSSDLTPRPPGKRNGKTPPPPNAEPPPKKPPPPNSPKDGHPQIPQRKVKNSPKNGEKTPVQRFLRGPDKPFTNKTSKSQNGPLWGWF